MAIQSKQDFIDYCLRRLGAPVIDINIDPMQIDDRYNDALQYYYDFHSAGMKTNYPVYKISQTDVNNRYLLLDDSVLGVSKIFPLQDTALNTTNILFDVKYQLTMQNLWDFSSVSYLNFELTRMHLQTLDELFNGNIPYRFNVNEKKLYLDANWGTSEISVGSYVVLETTNYMNPEIFPKVWEDRWLKAYATALIKRNWGENIKKYGGVQLPGGIVLNGKDIYNEAIEEIRLLEIDAEQSYGQPLGFFVA